VLRPSQLLRTLLHRQLPSKERDKDTRAAFWELAQTMTPYAAVRHRDVVFLLPTQIEPKMFVNGGRSEFVVLERACAILLEAGRLTGRGTIVDVGAHIGTTGLTALVRHGFARAVEIEPDPEHLPLLRANTALNRLDESVTVIAAAVSDSAGRAPFAQGRREEDASRWMKGRLAEKPTPSALPVETVTLDGLAEEGIADPATTGLVWFDCSSCEQAGLRSASAFLEQRVPLVFTVRRKQFSQPGSLFARLRETYGHVVDLRSPNLSEPLPNWTPTFRPVEDLAVLPEGKKLTDVLVF
jgi:FkbM family methyltransferase